ncbi:MAG: hypothetical protein SFU98_06740 [Leptospiraceae bacterium]|nr:hypothetical protein [Leptospiraceae bacterium]
MQQPLYENLIDSKLIKDLTAEFGIKEEVAVRRLFIALNNPDFTDSIFEQLKGYLNKIENLEMTDGRIEIVNMDK